MTRKKWVLRILEEERMRNSKTGTTVCLGVELG